MFKKPKSFDDMEVEEKVRAFTKALTALCNLFQMYLDVDDDGCLTVISDPSVVSEYELDREETAN